MRRPLREALVARLINRLGLDLSPAAGVGRGFLTDRAPNGYERHVDGLRESPHYG